jgi:hypothetical protein
MQNYNHFAIALKKFKIYFNFSRTAEFFMTIEVVHLINGYPSIPLVTFSNL